MACPECGVPLRLLLTHGADTEHAPLHREPQPEGLPDFEGSVKDFKRELLLRALKENGGVMTRAAKALGLKYTTFVAMAHRLGVAENSSADSAATE